MLQRLRVGGLKGFASVEDARFSRYTLIFGPNSAGKSTLAQSLLMLRQSTQHDAPGVVFPNGTDVSLGSFRTAVHRHDMNRDIFVGVDFLDQFGKSARVQKTERGVNFIPITPRAVEVDVHVHCPPSTSSVRSTGLVRKIEYRTTTQTVLVQATGGDDGNLSMPALQLQDLQDWALDPARAPAGRGFALELRDGEDGARHFVRTAKQQLYSWLSQITHVAGSRGALPRVVASASEMLDALGLPHGIDLESTVIAFGVNDAFSAMGIPYELSLESIDHGVVSGFVAPTLRHVRTGDSFSLSDVGQGIGHVLRIAIALEFNLPGLVWIEQPELHLHPRAVAALGDVIIERAHSAESGGQVVLETHSEALLDRFQRRVRDRRIAASDVSVLYVDQDEGGVSKVREIRLGEQGDFLDPWPAGFFDDSLDDRLGGAH